jgi:sugar transferase EpsL
MMTKRFFDVTVAALACVLLAPLYGVVAFLVKLKLGSPILYSQARPGLQGQTFNIYKFRTMSEAVDTEGRFLPDDKRLGHFGKFLRSTSLDELPEMWNVLRGDMSLVGPRPLLPSYLPLYTERQNKRHLVRPGVTGWAQINGRNAISWEERFELDVWYVENRSLGLDLYILLKTVLIVLSRKGVSAENHATMPPFEGQLLADRQSKSESCL